MMYRRIIILLSLFVLLCPKASASVMVARADSLDLSDSAFFSVLKNAQTDTVVVEKDRGYDVSGMVNARRWRPAAAVEFRTGSFSQNIFAAPYLRMFKTLHPDYSFAFGGGLHLGKWVTPSLAFRVSPSWIHFTDNFDARIIQGIDLGFTALFNLSSYLGGYDTSRFCEISVLGGIGGMCLWKRKLLDSAGQEIEKAKTRFTFSGHLGLNVNLRIFDRLNLFVEPQLGIYTNGLAISTSRNWRSYLLAFSTNVGLTYHFGQVRPEGERISSSWKRPKGSQGGYFVSVMAGTQFQNSELVFEGFKGLSKLGQHYSVGIGRHFTDYAGIRFSGSYSKNNWLKYNDGRQMQAEYVAISLEGMFDVVRMIKHVGIKKGNGKEQGWFGCSLLAGPQMGRVMKQDIQGRLSVHYVALVGGIQPSFRVHRNVTLFAEPRFSIVPYTAKSDRTSESNDNRNYYDGLFNFNIGMECRF